MKYRIIPDTMRFAQDRCTRRVLARMIYKHHAYSKLLRFVRGIHLCDLEMLGIPLPPAPLPPYVAVLLLC